MVTTSRRQFLQVGAAAITSGEFAPRRMSAAAVSQGPGDRMLNRRRQSRRSSSTCSAPWSTGARR